MAREDPRATEVRRIWDEFSDLYYAGRLPRPNKVRIAPSIKPGRDKRRIWARITHHANGHIDVTVAEATFDVGYDWVALCVLHEMIHRQIGVTKRHESEAWRAEVQRLSHLGALRHFI